MFVIKLIIFVIGTIGIVWVSRSSLRNVQNHGFYRFFAWETILVMFVLNANYWIIDPFSFIHLISWCLLIISLILIVQGVQAFRRKGKIDQARDAPALVGIEKTTELVTTGVYQTIRHPFYSSLLFLSWGIVLKRVSSIELTLALVATLLLTITAIKEEKENIAYFGEPYEKYMKQTKRFIPYIV
ncbi:MAG: isoprenylcysteine carboxylmethyltransferase family protein [Chloroflexi bacterium]|nr:MAG: isoprenylcysteine carboxylmethyltransferase family protein [Chloroflexota bacterium]